MRNAFLIVIAVLASITSFAQDTIIYGDTSYFWPGTPVEYTVSYPMHQNNSFFANGYTECYSQSPLVVWGISLVSNGVLINPNDNEYTDMYMKIFSKEGGSIFLLDSVRISKDDVKSAIKNRKHFMYDDWYSGINGRVDTLLHFYFNRPIMVRDTFYAGFHIETPSDDITDGTYCHNDLVFGVYHVENTVVTAEKSIHYWRPTSSWDNYTAFYAPSSFPIITSPAVDSIPPCPVANAPELIEAEDGFVSIRWAANSTVAGYEIAFGTDTLNPESNSIIETTSNVKFFSGLENNRYYAAWLRYKCHHHCYWHDTNTYSDWSEPLVFYLSDGNTEPEFIGGVLDLQMSIYPNPAKDEIMIETEGVPMQQLELYDIQGRLLKRVSQMEDREKCRLSIESLPVGRYVVKAITPFGITTQSFVKQ